MESIEKTYNKYQVWRCSRAASEFFQKRKFKHIKRVTSPTSAYFEVEVGDNQYLVRISDHRNLTVLSEKKTPDFNICDDISFRYMKSFFKKNYGYGE